MFEQAKGSTEYFLRVIDMRSVKHIGHSKLSISERVNLVSEFNWNGRIILFGVLYLGLPVYDCIVSNRLLLPVRLYASLFWAM